MSLVTAIKPDRASLFPKGTAMPRASARHILVDSEAECQTLKEKIAAGAKFADLARENSSCPSGEEGGELGEFSPGQMVKEFDDVVFSAPIGVVQGPIQTQFGWHLVEVTRRVQ
jgi:peptidyl-prolyl cis-trans isomerase C